MVRLFSIYVSIQAIIFFKLLIDKSKPPNRGVSEGIAVFGALPPKKESLEDICPPIMCADCPDPREKCKNTIVSLYDLVGHLEIKPTEDINYPGLPARKLGENR